MIIGDCLLCGRPVILAHHFMTKSSLLVEPRPWAPADEPEPGGLTPAALRAWRQALPYRLGLVYLLRTRVWDAAAKRMVPADYRIYGLVQARAKSRPYPHPWWTQHRCQEEMWEAYRRSETCPTSQPAGPPAATASGSWRRLAPGAGPAPP